MKSFLSMIAGITLLLLGTPSFAVKTPTAKSCRVVKSWLSGLSASDICSKNDGSFCSTVKNNGQGICYGMGGSLCATVTNTGQGICYGLDGSFCATVKNRAQGICYGLDESFCATLGADDNRKWAQKIAEACKTDLPPEFDN